MANNWVDRQWMIDRGKAFQKHFFRIPLVSVAVFCIAILVASTAASPVSAEPQVEIYVTSWCGYCKRLESFLKQEKIRFQRYDIESSRTARKRHRKLGYRGVPIIKVGDRVIPGYQPQAVLSALGR